MRGKLVAFASMNELAIYALRAHDAPEKILADGYFDAAAALLRVGDRIEVTVVPGPLPGDYQGPVVCMRLLVVEVVPRDGRTSGQVRVALWGEPYPADALMPMKTAA